MRKKILAGLRRAVLSYMVCALLCSTALAEGALIPVGEPVGIRVTVDGVLVVDVSEVETGSGALASPAGEAGVRAGDVITAINGREVTSAQELGAAIAALGGKQAELSVTRSGRQIAFFVSPVTETDGGPKLGLWLRDGITGIGTVTYIDPETGAFGALGHGVNDARSGALLPVEDGSVCRARIVDVKPGKAGEPGELAGSFSVADEIGRIRENTVYGIFGTMERSSGGRHAPVPVAAPEEVESGPATILACVSGGEAKEYDVEIARAGFAAGDGRDLTVHVTDPELIAATGGIVQGMSGSPILQNGKLVGAVTHVLTGDPARGYGIYAEKMVKTAEAA